MNNQQVQPAPQQTGWTAGAIVYLVVSIILAILYGYGAAKLSYNKYGSVGWAIIAFIFSPFYYPIYGIFLSTPATTGVIGAARKMKW